MIVSHEHVKFTETVIIRPYKFKCFFAVATLNDVEQVSNNKNATIFTACDSRYQMCVHGLSRERPIFRKIFEEKESEM